LVSSEAGARGFWQLMPETAKSLGLRVDDVVDERDDIEKSTKHFVVY
jgi:membrane-bound lytic murein transglycosylase MltF